MTKKPNIFIFMTDQQRGDSLTNPLIEMPNVRSLMKSGVNFKNTHCPSPHCCPSRATFFTGKYPTEHGVWNNVCVQNALSDRLTPGIPLFSENLKEKGYRMGYSGKWHVSYETGPEDHGFEEVYVTSNKRTKPDEATKHMSSGWEVYKKLAKTRDEDVDTPRKVGQIKRAGYPNYNHYGSKENPFNDLDVVNAAIEKLNEIPEDGHPWLYYLGTLGPHDPYFVPQKFLDMYKDVDIELTDIHFDDLHDKPHLYQRTQKAFNQLSIEEKKDAIIHYMAFCTYEDYLFGLVLDTLKKRSDFDDTLILFTSDHGDYNGEHGLWCKGLPAFKGAYHIPAVISWKNGLKNPNRTIDAPVSLADFAPTFLALVNEDTSTLTGQSLLPFIYDKKPETWREYSFTQTNGNEIYGIQRAVFNDKWKLVYNSFDYDELYNLDIDPDELVNLAADEKYKDIKKSLYRELWSFAESVNDKCLNPYIMVGLAEFGPAYAYE